jgi:8-oxo-dGTP pyrophosphatase MutT (NUDIX family)
LTSVPEAGPRLEVVGVDAQGAEVARLVLGHGEDPTILLSGLGWQVRRAVEVTSEAAEGLVLTMTFVVEAAAVRAPHTVVPFEPERELRRDGDLVMGEGEVPQRYQRVSAHAFVTSSRGVLMTQFSDRTNAPGQWGPPGGGLDPGEGPDRAVLREVWEESGQVVELSNLALVQSLHWIGRAPGGRLEDFHAVRLVYRAVCPEPTEPFVHDVGGTTASAAWLPAGDLELLAVTPGWRSVLRDVSNPDGCGA